MAQHLGLAGGRKGERLVAAAIGRDEVVKVPLGDTAGRKLRATVGVTPELVYQPFGTATTGVGAYLVWFDHRGGSVARARASRGLLVGPPVCRLGCHWVGGHVGGRRVGDLVGGRRIRGLVGGGRVRGLVGGQVSASAYASIDRGLFISVTATSMQSASSGSWPPRSR